ncbi:MAG: tRNA uridine-5-carboxymethylaminomethyl(34) synthesis enzyme MnmG [Candidatus Omnitrophota bacterium]
MKKYDVIVIGAGHAGIEASYAAAKLGCSVLLLTIDTDGIGKLSCNPSVGGVSKGNLVREVDALGGLIGRIADKCALNYRILNRSKGKAVWATRAQVDRFLYPKIARSFLENSKNIQILKAKVKKILTKNNRVYAIETNFGEKFSAKSVIVCAGTFLKSKIHIGLNSFPGGRLYEESCDELFDSIKKLGVGLKHFKTGTPPRLDKRTINFSKLQKQLPDMDAEPFSNSSGEIPKDQMSCFIAYTNKKTHRIVLNNLSRSPLYAGKIKSQGVRYCPSLEDKVVKFSDKDRHQVFIEPEGRDALEVYPNGVSTSLPFDVQVDFIHTIVGLESARLFSPGYGIEYGLIDARSLYSTLESKKITGLYFAGQVNGTTGYEEAASQGIISGINAALAVKRKKPFILARTAAGIGVLIDDLVIKGTDEPYRMFTSRCEFRLTLRESNADIRLVPLACKLGLLEDEDYERILNKQNRIACQIKKLKSKRIFLNGRKITLFDILKRPGINFSSLEEHLEEKTKEAIVQREIEIEVKYEEFLRRESLWLKELKNLHKIRLPKVDFSKIPSLSNEVVEKLKKFKPHSLGEALSISGITPAAILNIYNFIKKKHKDGKQKKVNKNRS